MVKKGETLIQIRNELFSLEHFKTINDIQEFKKILNDYDVRLLKDRGR